MAVVRRRLTERGVLTAYRMGAALARALPGPVANALAEAIGLVLGAAMGGRRRTITRHLSRVHEGTLGRAQLRRAVRGAFRSYARYWVESFRLPALSPSEIDADFACEGMDHLEAAVARGQGAIIALPHLGGWEVGGAWLMRRGHPITVVVEPLDPPALFDWFAEFRRSLGMTIVPLGPAAGGAILAALRANAVVCLLCDRDVGGGGVEVELFGERTTLPGGPVTLGLRTGAAVLPTAVYFEGRDGHRAVIRPPLPLSRTGRLRDDVARGTQALAVELEGLVRRAPDQWHLFQPNWPSDRE